MWFACSALSLGPHSLPQRRGSVRLRACLPHDCFTLLFLERVDIDVVCVWVCVCVIEVGSVFPFSLLSNIVANTSCAHNTADPQARGPTSPARSIISVLLLCAFGRGSRHVYHVACVTTLRWEIL